MSKDTRIESEQTKQSSNNGRNQAQSQPTTSKEDDFDILEVVRARQSEEHDLAERLDEEEEDEDTKIKEQAKRETRSEEGKLEQGRNARRRRPRPRHDGRAATEATSSEPKQEEDHEELDMLKVVRARIQAQAENDVEETKHDVQSRSERPRTAPAQNTARPGAYATEPGLDPLRISHLRYSLLGAAVQDECLDEQSNTNPSYLEEGPEEGPAPQYPDYPGPELTNSVVVAIEVEDEESLPEADAMDDESLMTIQSEKSERERRFKVKTWLLLGVIFVAVAGLMLVVMWQTGFVRTTSSTPTPAPTQALQLPPEEYVQSFLPNDVLQSLRVANSPQAKAFVWMVGHPSLYDLAEWRVQQQFALVTLYHATDGFQWTSNIDWLSYNVSECQWYSKTSACQNDEGVVDTLDLEENHLEGQLPWDALSLLTNLKTVNLKSNELSGAAMTPHVGSLSHLSTISLSFNELTGQIPSEIGHLSQLANMDVVQNSLSGPLPTEIGELTELVELFLYENALTSTIPTQVGLVTKLQWLNLYSNSFSGVLPSELGMVNMTNCLLDGNFLGGTLPSQFSKWGNIHTLNIHDNEFSGSLPAWIGSWSNLEDLQIANNSFTGSLPSEIGLMDSLRILYADLNLLSSSIPSEIGQLSLLYQVQLSQNWLTGDLPSEIGRLSELIFLQLGYNHFNGTIPTAFGRLKDLFTLDLRNSYLSGPIPSELARMENLNGIHLNNNRLTSTVPTELGLLSSSLERLELFNNQLTGPLPSELGLLTHLEIFELDQNVGLTGTVPEEISQLVRAEGQGLYRFNISSTGITGELPSGLCAIDPERYLAFDCSSTLCGCSCSCDSGRGRK